VNNSRGEYLSIRPDPMIAGGPTALTASLIDHSGVDNINVSLNVTNQGTATAKNVSVAFEAFLNDVPQTEFPPPIVLATLAPGETAVVSFLVDGLAGVHRYRAIVTGGRDSDFSNNVAQTMLIVQGLPDLVPTSVVPEIPNPRQGHPLNIRATIDNLGIDSADAFRVEVFAGPGEPANYGLLVGSTVVDHVNALGTVLAVVSIDTSKLAGSWNLCVVVDRAEHIFEQNDRNNVVCSQVFFLPAAENRPPDVTAPDSLTVIAGVTTQISGIQIFDPDAGDAEIDVTLEVESGQLMVSTDVLGGIVARQVIGNGTADLRIHASIAAINATFSAGGLSYQTGPRPPVDDRLRIVVDDLGHTGPGGPKTTSINMIIHVDADTPQDIDTLSRLIRDSVYAAAYDFDLDRDVDDDDLAYFVTEILKTNFGDANLDRVFNSSDLVAVFQAGKYEDGIPRNATWAEGDWNADGDFDTSDLVQAFQAGAYSSAAIGVVPGRAAAHARWFYRSTLPDASSERRSG
jgi:hypothetical protein